MDTMTHKEDFMENKKGSFNRFPKGFTLAEILITLAIVGVIAALVMPSMIANYQKKVWVVQLQKSVSVLENGFKLMLAQDGVDKLSDTELWTNNALPDDIYSGFSEPVISGLNKYFKFLNNNPGSIRLSREYVNSSNTWGYWPPMNNVHYLADGAMVIFALMKQPNETNCDAIKAAGGSVCEIVGQLIIDVNGDKKPNKFGRDTFEFVVNNDSRLVPIGSMDYALWQSSGSNTNSHWDGIWDPRCSLTDGRGNACAARIIENGWVMDY